MARVPVVRLGNLLVATVHEEVDDSDALSLQTELSELLESTGASGVILDITVVEIVDSFLGRLLNEMAQVARLLGAQTVVVGMQPAVAITLVELGLEFRGIHTALNAEKGFALLRRLEVDAAQRGLPG